MKLQYAVLAVVALAVTQACADLLGPKEVLLPPVVSIGFGAAGTGTESCAAYGLSTYNDAAPIRFYDGAGTQATGAFDLAVKLGPTWDEMVTDIMPNRVPATGGALYGGGTFDGTALWVVHSRFSPGGAGNLVGLQSPPTVGTLPAVTAGIRVTDITTGQAASVPMVEGVTTQKSYVWSQQVYIPGHSGDVQSGRPVSNSLVFRPIINRGGYLTQEIWGAPNVNLTLTTDQWHLVEVRMDVTTLGGATPAADTASYEWSLYSDGVLIGSRSLPSSMITPSYWWSRTSGDVYMGMYYENDRGYQFTAIEGFIDNITASAVMYVPEPSALVVLALGTLGLFRRRRQG